MKKKLIGIGIAFMDIVIKSDYEKKNHSHFSSISYEVGGSILNIVANCKNSGLIYIKGNDAFSNITLDYLHKNDIQTYPIEMDAPMPIFTIINQKERYTSLTKQFEIHDDLAIDLSVCNDYLYGITNSENKALINRLLLNTNTKWIINSYIPEGVLFSKLAGCIMNREEAKKYHEDPYEVLQFLRNEKIPWAVITLDKDGCMYLQDDVIYLLSPTNKHLKSKIRTGDLFTATIINMLYENKPLSEAIQEAMYKVEQFLIHSKNN